MTELAPLRLKILILSALCPLPSAFVSLRLAITADVMLGAAVIASREVIGSGGGLLN